MFCFLVIFLWYINCPVFVWTSQCLHLFSVLILSSLYDVLVFLGAVMSTILGTNSVWCGWVLTVSEGEQEQHLGSFWNDRIRWLDLCCDLSWYVFSQLNCCCDGYIESCSCCGNISRPFLFLLWAIPVSCLLFNSLLIVSKSVVLFWIYHPVLSSWWIYFISSILWLRRCATLKNRW